MAEKKSAALVAREDAETPSKAMLQRRMEETRESISQTVDEIKDTVSEQYETVKETVTEVLDWKEQFQKNPLVWGVGAVAVGVAVGYSIALVRQGDRTHSSRSRRSSSSSSRRTQANDFTDTVFDGLATLGQSYILPAVAHKVEELFGVNIRQELMGIGMKREPVARKRSTKKTGVKKKATKKRTVKKSSSK